MLENLNFDFNKSNFQIRIWNGEKLGKVIACDTETTMVPFHMTPDLVTTQVYDGRDTVYYVEKNKLRLFFGKHYGSSFIFHNAPFDISVLEKELGSEWVYDLYDRNLVHDTSVLYRLLHLAQIGFIPHKYNLNLLSQKYLNEELTGKDDIQCDFGKYLGKDLGEIPTEHLIYGAKDSVATHSIYLILSSLIQRLSVSGTTRTAWGKWGLLSAHIQVKGEWALSNIFKNGIGFDLPMKDEWLDKANQSLTVLQDRLAMWGWIRGQKGLKERYERIINLLGLADKLPRTDSGGISSKGDDLEPYRNISFIDDYLDFIELEKTTTFVRDVDTDRLHPRYTSIMTTGRTSCSKPNVQQIPRKGGIREMFIPKPGYKLIDIDYSSLELAALAQVNINLFRYSTMGDLINEGKCLHYNTAESLYEKPKEEITKEERQFSKIPNFGFGANMSPITFVTYCNNYGINITEQRAIKVKDMWLKTYPEMVEYYKTGNNDNHATLTGRIRANCTYTAYLNTGFQGLSADGFKLAMYEVTKEGYTIVAEIHDQLIIEIKEEDSETSLPKIQKIMEDCMSLVIPDVNITTEGMILDRWCK